MATAEPPKMPNLIAAPGALDDWIERNAPPDIVFLWRVYQRDYENLESVLAQVTT